ncbi:MAG: bacillithiol biosynthesis deacetylase BshB1 [Ignavibacteriae bacterium]|nr:bacillithiol biosynthesis deacetylase BshB1 [Ignavibacteriota bacterium]MCB9210383.1 bacillithiol biosynthesis deacetylase BshB1 [Ignavibacteriales bacterium]MCB9219188.1 bacillithiol biosynthesis deacetylase BshB1 [Ignavibacteriales bacterium]MCB9259770.1 bacillithiol biosynthesis deacetylase BshB1 [Ignavibacteriales bacterium]
MKLDYLAFAAHPDDAELSMGGTIAKLIKQNKKFGIIDLTAGELGSRGNKKTRAEEAKSANKILNLSIRENLGFKDGSVFADDKNTLKIVEIIRKYEPKIIFAPYFNDRHPDHIETSKLIKRAMFFSGVTKVKTKNKGIDQRPFRPKNLFYFMQTYEFQPSFIVDISDTFEIKMKSVLAYKTQFFIEGAKNNEPNTFISNPEFVKYLEARAKTFGFKIGKKYGEPFFSEEAIEIKLENYAENSQ